MSRLIAGKRRFSRAVLGVMRRFGLAGLAVAGLSAPVLAQDLPTGAGFLTRFSGTTEVIVGGVPRTVIDVEGTTGTALDLTTPPGLPSGQQWQYPPELFGSTAAQTGQIFGVALDDATEPNIYVTATSAFGLHRSLDGTDWMDGQWGAEGGAGTVYRLAAFNGYVPEIFANITLDGRPNSGAALGNIAYDKWNRQFYVSDLETGMIHRLRLSDGFDAGQYDHGLDGRANFVDAATGLSESLPTVAFDPATSARIGDCPSGDFARDPSCWNVADFRRRVWGLGVRHDDLTGQVRLFYAVWSSQGLGNPDHLTAPEEWQNTIWSVGISEDGAFNAADVRREAVLPDFFRDPAAIARAGYSHPVTDIAFPFQGAQDVMLVAERGGLRNRGLNAEDAFAMRQESRVLRLERDVEGLWQVTGRYDVGYQDRELTGPPYLRAGAAGGVAFALGYDATGALDPEAADAFVWITGDGLCAPEGPCRDAAGELTDITQVHGLQGNAAAELAEVEPAEAFQPYPFPGPATPTTGLDASHLADADLGRNGTENDATRIGDIAVYQNVPAFAWTPEDYPWWPVPDPDPGAPDLELVKTGPAICDWGVDCDFLITITNVGSRTYEGPIHISDYSDQGHFMGGSPGWDCSNMVGVVPISCRHDTVALAPGDSVFLVLTFRMPIWWGAPPEFDIEGLNCAAIIWFGGASDPVVQIVAMELALFHEGYDPGFIDGVYDADMQAAIDAYRADNGLPPGGIDAELYAALYPGDAGMAGDANPANDTDCHPFILPGENTDIPMERLDLAVNKELLSAECLPGDICNFRVTILNEGTEPYEGPLAFFDVAGFEGFGAIGPAAITSGSPPVDCGPYGPGVLCNYDVLAEVILPPSAGFGFIMRVAMPAVPPSEDFGNCAVLHWGVMGLPTGDDNPGNDHDCAYLALPMEDAPQMIALAVEKTLAGDCRPGVTCGFTVRVTNDGEEPINQEVVIGDYIRSLGIADLPAEHLRAVGEGAPCESFPGASMICRLDFTGPATLEPGETFAFDVDFDWPGGLGGILFNCAHVRWEDTGQPGGDENADNDENCVGLMIAPRVFDLAVDKTHVTDDCRPGGVCNFFTMIRNEAGGPFDGTVVYGDYLDMDGIAGLPATAMRDSSGDNDCESFPGGSVLCSFPVEEFGPLAEGGDRRTQVAFDWPEGLDLDVIRNCIEIRWDEMGMPEGDIDPSNDRVCVEFETQVIPQEELVPVLLDLAVAKSAPDTCEQGSSCAFDITITNNGPGDFIGPIFFADELSEGPMGALIGASSGLSCYVISDANGFCRQAPLVLEVGEAITVTAVWPVPGDYPPGAVENCATVGFPRGPGDAPNLLMVQAALLQQGYEVVLSNNMDPQTQGAIVAYRDANGLPAGDFVDDDLLDALFGDAGALSADRIPGNDRGCDTLNVVESTASRADLAVMSQTECVRGESCRVEAWIENVGEDSFEGVAGMRGELNPALAITSLKSQRNGFICATTGAASYECLGARLSLAPGEQARVELLLDVPADYGPNVVLHVKDMIWPDASVQDPNGQNDSNSEPIDIVDPPEPETPPMPDLSVSKVANQGSCQAGALCRFSVNVTNNGSGTFAGDIRITDTLSPSSASLQGFSPSVWSCTGSGGQISCVLPGASLAQGASQPLSLTVRPSSRLRGTLTNCAELNWTGDVPVRDVQAALNAAGFNAGTADGIPGRRTQAAIIAYQTANGLTPTGAIDAALLQSLMGLQSAGDPVAENDQDCARVNVIAPPTVTPDPEPDPDPTPAGPTCPRGWEQVTVARANALSAQGWKVERFSRGGATIVCATPGTPQVVLECPGGFDQVSRAKANALRSEGYTIQRLTGGGQTIWCAKAPPAASCPSGYRQVSRAEAKTLAGTHDIKQVGNLLCAKRRAVILKPEIELAPGLKITPQIVIPQLR